MRLLNTHNLEVKGFGDDEVPQYAILSHTWGEEEVTLQDMEGSRAAKNEGYEKVRRCCSLAKANGFAYVWIDTCCIDKTSSAELSEAINSMYRWYQEAKVCYAYLADVPSKSKFRDSRWFTRGWTLQELISPSMVIFFDEEWKQLGTKADLQQDIFECTGIPIGMLSGDNDLETFSIAQRMSWAAKRKTSRIEDRAYCLLGIFGINMPLIYGERETAFIRLQEEVMRFSDDHSLFAWKSSDTRGGLLATSPAAFVGSGNIVQINPFDTFNSPLAVSSRGIYLELRFLGIGPRGLGLAILHCKEGSEKDKPIAIYVRDLFLTMEQFERVQSENFELFNPRTFKQSQYPMRRICILKGRMTFLQKSKSIGKCDSIAPKEIYPNDKLPNLMNFGSQTDFFSAVERGLEDAVWLLLTRNDIRANLQDKHGQTALSLATRVGHEIIVKMLLGRSDIMVDSRDHGQRTPLSWAAENGNEAIVQRLLDKGADIESKDKADRTPLWWASENGHEAVVQLLLEKGADTELKDIYGRTRLSWAARTGQ
ncbi:hypothetical protein OIDMADRAFT_202037, partial [Oidiodendron maius Zn]